MKRKPDRVTLTNLMKIVIFMPNLRNIFRTIKPFLGRMQIEIDRNRQIIYFKKNGRTEIMTVNQLFDEIESIFTKAKPTVQTTMDPFCGGSIDHISPPNSRISPPGGSWLSNYDKPQTNPLGINDQALSEPARPPAAPHS